MARNWYQEQEDEMEDRNESFGRAFVESLKKEQQEILKQKELAKLYTHRNGQLSLFEEIVPEHKFVGTTRGIIKLTKRDYGFSEEYIEEYGPEFED